MPVATSRCAALLGDDVDVEARLARVERAFGHGQRAGEGFFNYRGLSEHAGAQPSSGLLFVVEHYFDAAGARRGVYVLVDARDAAAEALAGQRVEAQRHGHADGDAEYFKLGDAQRRFEHARVGDVEYRREIIAPAVSE